MSTAHGLTAAASRFAAAWGNAATAEAVAPALGCTETAAIVDLLRMAGKPAAADDWLTKHVATESKCQGHEDSPADIAGLELFTIADLAQAVVDILGNGWHSQPCRFSASAYITVPGFDEHHFELFFDYKEGDLVVGYWAYQGDGLPADVTDDDLPDGTGFFDGGVYLENVPPGESIDVLAQRVTTVLHIITGR
ncbi:hypothetical protein [Streptomyces sp. NPDC004376]